MTTGTILIVEDEVKLAELLRDYLQASGFETELLHRGDGVVEQVRQREPDAMLLDLMLPGMDGTEICREVRKFSQVPILMVTAKTEEIDRLLGLELGADDYISKPFSPREVVARVKAVLRRARLPQTEGPLLKAGPLILNPETRLVHVGETALDLTPTEFGLLKAFLHRPERVFSRDELLNQVQGYDFAGYDRTIDTHIKNLRKKLMPFELDRCIGSVYGVGYRFSLP